MLTQTYTMEEENVEKLRKVKKQYGSSMSWLINRAVEEYIENHNLL